MIWLWEAIGHIINLAELLRWWRSTLCVFATLALAWGLDAVGVLNESLTGPTVVLAGVAVGLLWEATAAVDRWTRSW